MVTQYPAQIDSIVTLPTVVDNVTPWNGDVVNRLRDAILHIEIELGVKPSGLLTTVRSRLDNLDLVISQLVIQSGSSAVVFSRDINGNNLGQTVVGIQNFPISTTAPTSGQGLIWNGFTWTPTNIPSGFSANGDLAGTSNQQVVVGLQGRQILGTTPAPGQMLSWNGTAWTPSANFLTQNITTSGGLLAGPAITSSLMTGVETLNGKFIVNNIPTNSSVSDSGQGIIYFDQTSNHFMVSENGSSYTQFLFTANGDLSGSTSTQTVIRINGATVPAAGSLTTSTVLQVSGSSALTYALLANANISNTAAIAGTKISPNFGSQNIITTGNLTISGPLTWASGNAPATGFATSQFPSDANYTAAASELNAKTINVTSAVSLTTTRNYILPLTAGSIWIINNLTTGGETIHVTGTSGNGVDVLNGTSALISTDGTNFYGSSGSGASGFVSNIVTVTNTYTALATDEIVKTNSNGGAFTVNLPTPSIAIHKKRIVIKDSVGIAGTNNITVGRNGATIDGASSNYTVAINFGSVTMVYDNNATNWSIV